MLFAPLLVLAACAADDGTGPVANVPAQGRFLDGAVEGLRYSAGSLTGFTGADGTFFYEKGSTVAFRIGGVEIGHAPATFIMTPIDLVGHGLDEGDSVVTNIVRFLVTLDDDGDSFSNAITIPESIHRRAEGESLNFDQSIAAFENDPAVQRIVTELTSVTTAGVRDLVPVSLAQVHLQLTLRTILSGTYHGTYYADVAGGIGPALGTWRIVVFSFGSQLRITGLVTEADGTEVEFLGIAETDGSFEAPLFGIMTLFGQIEISDEGDAFIVNGTWLGPADGTTGTFSGGRL